MIFPQTNLSPQLCKRYAPLAGPFEPAREEALFEALLSHLNTSGARVLTVSEIRGNLNGVSIYRLRSECETREQTRRRLAKR